MAFRDGFEHILRENEPLTTYTWFRLGGPAEWFAEPTTVDELAALVRRCRQEDLPVRLLGGGSNVLVRDEGVPGLVVHLSAAAFSEIERQGARLHCGGGAKLSHVISIGVREGLAGLENLVGIPGTVGGALHGNSGTDNNDVGQWTRRATVMTRAGEIHERQGDDLRFAYRRSSLDELVILSATFELEEEEPAELVKRMQTQWIQRKAAQPASGTATGCIFKNPGGISAEMLIDQAGLKGTRIGEAEVSDQHANFIVAHAGATAADVLRLIDLIRGRVEEHLGIELETEIEIW